MSNLSTKYMGIALKNPIIIGSSNLVKDKHNLQRLEESGAGAIIYKSLFEEQIQLESLQLQDQLDRYNERHAEMIDLFPDLEHAGPQQYLIELKRAKEAINIPLIASINAVYKGSWVNYAKKIEETGVAGIELNFYFIPKDFDLDGQEIMNEQLEVLKEIKKSVNIPVSVKLTPFYTNALKFIKQLDREGAQAFVLFNRLFQPDIDIDNETHFYPYNLSGENDNRLALRYAGLLYGNINADVAASNGVFTGYDVIKMLLAGAQTVQVVSTIYKNNFKQITRMLKEIEDWMKNKGYETLDDFRGKLSKNKMNDPFVFKRAQYIDILMKSEKIFEKYPMV